MRISAKAIINYTDTNHFAYADQWIVRAGDSNTLYFQLVDLDQAGLRYMPGVSLINQPVNLTVTFPTNAASLYTFNANTNGGFVPFGSTVTFPVLDQSQVFTVTAVQASSFDPSIWSVSFSSLQTPNSGNVQFTLIEGTNVRKFFVTNLIDVEHLNSGNC
jgi:hypothetical protein